MKRTLTLSTLLAAGLLGCGTEAPAPDKPTWVDDVLPILEANCFHCHGAMTDQNGNVKNLAQKLTMVRWDIYDISDPTWAKLGITKQTYQDQGADLPSFTGAIDPAVSVLFNGLVASADLATRMPPPPATALSARDQKVISNWMGDGKLLGKRFPNSKPRVSWLDNGKVYQVLDADGDQVLGKLSCSNGDYPIDRSGAHVMPKDAVLPCTADVYDGFDEVTANLK